MEEESLSDFFKRHIGIIKSDNRKCQECGERLSGQASEIAHILPKGVYKSMATVDENVLYLCGHMSDNDCHSEFDSSNSNAQNMNVFEQAREVVFSLKELCTERLSLSIRKRYQI